MTGIALFTISALMLAATAAVIARRTAPPGAERFWIFIAAIILQFGSFSLILSWLSAFAPVPFLILQGAVLIALVLPHVLPRRGAANASGPPPPTLLHQARDLYQSRAIRRFTRDPISMALILAMLIMLALSGAQQWLTPLVGHDERMYHAPRALFWVQHQSILPFETHNDRHTVFPFAAELSFAWTALFIKDEFFGRMVFWLALPATVVGVYLLSREVRVPRRYALGAALLYITTPVVLKYAASLKSDAWQPLMVMGAAYFALRALGQPRAAPRRWMWSGILLACALAVKTTSLGITPGLLVVVLARPFARWPRQADPQQVSEPPSPLRRGALALRHAPTGHLGALALGLVAGAVLSAFASLVVWNIRDHGHPFGPPELSKVVQAEISAVQLRTHAARLPVYLFEFPGLPEQTRAWLLKNKEAFAEWSGATRLLPMERPRLWPGTFIAILDREARYYSLGGLLWLPLLAVGIVRIVRELVRRWPFSGPIVNRVLFSRVSLVVIMQLPLFLALVFYLRWAGGAPDRFWLAAYALQLPVIAYFVALWARRAGAAGGLVAGSAILLLAWAAYPAILQRITIIERAGDPRMHARADEPYQHILPHLGRGDCILLFVGQGSRDYALFGPRDGFSRRLIPWGKREFDEAQLRDLLERQPITHVLFEHHSLAFHWAGTMSVERFIEWFKAHSDFEQVDLEIPASAPPHAANMLLFRRISHPQEPVTRGPALQPYLARGTTNVGIVSITPCSYNRRATCSGAYIR